MKNIVVFEGEITKVLFKNNQVLKFYLENRDSKKIKKIKVTSFNTDDFLFIEENIGKIVKINGEIYENNYKDKNGNWINDYTINMKGIEIKDNNLIKEIAEDDMPF